MHIVSGSYDQTIQVWDAYTGDTVAGSFKGHTSSVESVAFSPDGMHIVSGSTDQTIRVWDAYTGEPIAGPFKGHTDSVTSVAFSPDGMHIVSGSRDQTIRVWDANTGDTVAGSFKGQTNLIESVAFSSNSTTNATGQNFTDISVNPSLLSYHVHSDILSMDNFTFEQDGWITAHNVLFLWISPQFYSQLPSSHNPLVIGPQGTTFIHYCDLCIGKTWSDCYLS